MARYFINYRRDDAAGVAGRLHDHLAKSFTRSSLFMDVDTMKPGVDFAKQIEAQVAQCDVLLAVVGPQWLDAKDATGARRLLSDRDYVRMEIASALKRDIPVVPVLIDGARLPDEYELPDDLKPFVRRHAMELRHTRFAADADAIASALRAAVPDQQRRWPRSLLAGAALATLCSSAALLAFWLGPTFWKDERSTAIDSDSPKLGKAGTAGAVVEDARRRIEEARSRSATIDKRTTPRSELSGPASEPEAQPGPTVKELAVALGDSFDQVRKVYPAAADAGGGDLSMPLDGIRFFFSKDDRVLRSIRVDAPFLGGIRGVHITDAATELVARLGQPSYVQGDSYFFRSGGSIVRFDLDKSKRVATIFQILASKIAPRQNEFSFGRPPIWPQHSLSCSGTVAEQATHATDRHAPYGPHSPYRPRT